MVGREKLHARFLDTLLMRAQKSKPTNAHQAINDFAGRKNCAVITENIDALHCHENFTTLLELHGNITRARCRACGALEPLKTTYQQLPTLRCRCGGELRADLLFFDEKMDEQLWRRAEKLARASELFIVIGSSGQVLPGGLLPALAKRGGAFVIEINIIPTEISPHCHLTIIGDSEQAVPKLLKEL
jgi:NAD-dependent deacetylase